MNIEQVIEEFNQSFNGCCLTTKIALKCWLNHSESRAKNGNAPFGFDTYTQHMRDRDYLDLVRLNVIDCSDIGGKEKVIEHLEWRTKGE